MNYRIDKIISDHIEQWSNIFPNWQIWRDISISACILTIYFKHSRLDYTFGIDISQYEMEKDLLDILNQTELNASIRIEKFNEIMKNNNGLQRAYGAIKHGR
jgi:hypothetical protein